MDLDIHSQKYSFIPLRRINHRLPKSIRSVVSEGEQMLNPAFLSSADNKPLFTPILLEPKPTEKVTGINRELIRMFKNQMMTLWYEKYNIDFDASVRNASLKAWFNILAIEALPCPLQDRYYLTLAHHTGVLQRKIETSKRKQFSLNDPFIRGFIKNKDTQLYHTYLKYLKVQLQRQKEEQENIAQANSAKLDELFNLVQKVAYEPPAGTSDSQRHSEKTYENTLVIIRLLATLLAERSGLTLFASHEVVETLKEKINSDPVTSLINSMQKDIPAYVNREKTIARTNNNFR